MPHTQIQPAGWKPAKGYANGMAGSGRMLFVAGQVGWTAEQVFDHHDFAGQTEQCLRNILAVVEAAGGKAADITRLTWFITDKGDYQAKQREIGEAYRRVMGRHFPAMSLLVVAALLEDEALVEIEATALLSQQD